MVTAWNTDRTYASHVRTVEDWLGENVLLMTPADVLRFISSGPYQNPRTLNVKLAAIRQRFHEDDRVSPTHHPSVVRARRFDLEKASKRCPRPLVWVELVDVVNAIPQEGAKAIRDRALLALGWWARMEAHELVNLEGRDVSYPNSETWQVDIRIGRPPRVVKEHLDPTLNVRQLVEAWRAYRFDRNDLLFGSVDRWGYIGDSMSEDAVRRVVKERCKAVGFHGWYAGNSLKQGRSAR